MPNYREALIEFHKTMFNKTGDWKADTNQKLIIGNPTAQLRAALISEEALELCDALLLEDESQVRKELCDLLYVLYGTVVVFNLPIEEDFERVHENNMLKFKTASVGPNGKLIKHPDHPKVVFT